MILTAMMIKISVLPLISDILLILTDLFGSIILICVAISILLSIVGLKVKTNIGAEILRNFFKLIGFLLRNLFSFFIWFGKRIKWLMEKTFKGVKESLETKLSGWLSTLLASVATIIVFILII